MKKLLLSLVGILLINTSFCQKGFSSDTSEVVTASGVEKATLYSNALTFFAETFKSANDVIQMKDPASGKIIGKGFLKDRKITITIEVKDEKFRYQITTEPYIENKEIRLENVNKLGSLKGETYLSYGYVNGILVIDKDKTYFDYDGFGGKGKYYYNNTGDWNGSSQLIGTKKGREEWKENVDKSLNQIIDKLKIYDTPSEDTELITIIKKLKDDVSKKDNW